MISLTLRCYCYFEFIAGCDGEFMLLNSSTGKHVGCYSFILTSNNWTNSAVACSNLDKRAHLAVINDRDENLAIGHYLRRFPEESKFFVIY